MAPKRTKESPLPVKRNNSIKDIPVTAPPIIENDIYTCLVYGLLSKTDLRKAVPSIISAYACDFGNPFQTSHANSLAVDMSREAALKIIRRNEEGRIGAREFSKLCLRRRPVDELSFEAAVTRISSYFRMFWERRRYRVRLSDELEFLGISKKDVTEYSDKLVSSTEHFDDTRLKMDTLLASLTHEWTIGTGPALRGGIWKFKQANGRFPDSIEQVEELISQKVLDFVVPPPPVKSVKKPPPKISVEEPKTDDAKMKAIFRSKMMQELNSELAALKGIDAPVNERPSDQNLRDVQQDFVDLVKLGFVQVLPACDQIIANIPTKSLLLYGPPGCGKSWRVAGIAHALARSQNIRPVWVLNLKSIPPESIRTKIFAIATIYGPFVVVFDSVAIEKKKEKKKEKIVKDFSLGVFLNQLSATTVVIGTTNRVADVSELKALFADTLAVFPPTKNERNSICKSMPTEMTEGLTAVDLCRARDWVLSMWGPGGPHVGAMFIDPLSRMKPVVMTDWQTAVK